MTANSFAPLVFILLLVDVHAGGIESSCMDGSTKKIRKVEFDLTSKKNETGHWITSFTVSNASPRLPNNWKVHVMSDVDCTEGLQRFQMQGILVAPPPIPQDYILYPGVGYYKMHPKSPGGFDEARATCVKEGAHLAIINSKAENQVVHSMVTKGSAYLGFHDRVKEGEFITVFGDPLNSTGFNGWLPNEPSNGAGLEHCGSYYFTGGFNDVPCDRDYPFICEFDLTWAH